MANLRHDFELRRTLIKLRRLSVDDFDAVIEGLDEPQRAYALNMLAELDGHPESEAEQEAPESFDVVTLPDGVSPWLVARINGRGDAGDETADHFELTPHVQRILRKLAADLIPQTQLAGRGTSLFSRLWRGVG